MLRALVSIIGLALAGSGLYMILAVHGAAAPGAVNLALGVLVLAGLFLEPHYRSRAQGSGPGWEPTGEKFIDPGTGRLVEVDYDPKTGQREYRDAE
jgi:hypothetical protein